MYVCGCFIKKTRGNKRALAGSLNSMLGSLNSSFFRPWTLTSTICLFCELLDSYSLSCDPSPQTLILLILWTLNIFIKYWFRELWFYFDPGRSLIKVLKMLFSFLIFANHKAPYLSMENEVYIFLLLFIPWLSIAFDEWRYSRKGSQILKEYQFYAFVWHNDYV